MSPWRLFSPTPPNSWHRRVLLLMALATTALAGGGTFTGVYSVVKLDGEQKAGVRRDAVLAKTDRQLRGALVQIRDTRVSGVKLTCRLNRRQNKVLLALIAFSVRESKRRGRVVDPRALAQTNALLRPITKKSTNRICSALLRNARAQPPPPPSPRSK